jgi:hypothetical protein
MKINKNNYEAFFLDYHEGNLPPEQVEELMVFLQLYPHLKESFTDFEPVLLPDADAIEFENKAALKKHSLITSENCDDFFIRYVENVLNAEEQKQLQAFLNINPIYNKEFALFKKTKLLADTAIVFEGKSQLKKSTKEKPAILYYWSAAAAVAVLLISYFMINQHDKIDETRALSAYIPYKREIITLPVNKDKNTALLALKLRKQQSVSKPALTAAVIAQTIPKSNKHSTINSAPVQLLPFNKLHTVPYEKHYAILKIRPLLFNTAPVVTTAVNPASNSTPYLSLTEFATKKMNERYSGLDEEDKEEIVSANASSKNAWNAVFAKILTAVTGKQTAIATRRDDDGQITAYQFSAGNIEFSKSISK